MQGEMEKQDPLFPWKVVLGDNDGHHFRFGRTDYILKNLIKTGPATPTIAAMITPKKNFKATI